MLRIVLLASSILSSSILLFGQSQPTPPPAAQDSSSSAPGEDSNTAQWRKVFTRTLQDQRSIYLTFPRDMARGKLWLPVGAFLGGTAALIATDQFESGYFRRSTTYHSFNNALSGTNTSLIVLAVPAATYLTGFVTGDNFAKESALMTGEAVADSEILAEVLKLSTQRSRPESIPLHGNFADTWTDSRTISDGSFPSGHTIAAFSVATIMANRYGKEHKWAPYVAYGGASLIGFSRITLSAHNVSDVLVGAALGYAISRFVVLPRWHSVHDSQLK